jgi:phosphoglycerate dehydrogenase-like enzyme
MTVTVAMFDTSWAYIRDRVDALGLDIRVLPFGADGQFLIDGARVAPRDVAVDYVWLSTHLHADGFQPRAFEMMLNCKSIGVLQTFNAGLDNPFYQQIARKGTRICNSSAQGIAIAEYTLAHVLSLVHPIDLQRELQAQKQWKGTPFREISQMNWLIVGFGPIGQEVAKRVQAFGATVSVIRRSPAPSPLADQMGTMADLKTMLPKADVVVLACALNDQTRGFANATFFTSLKPGTILVNIARGGVIDEPALLEALNGDRLATAVLDVFQEEPLPVTNPLWAHPKVRLTAHTSNAGSGSRARWDQLFLDNIQRFVKGEPLANEVSPRDLI